MFVLNISISYILLFQKESESQSFESTKKMRLDEVDAPPLEMDLQANLINNSACNVQQDADTQTETWMEDEPLPGHQSDFKVSKITK